MKAHLRKFRISPKKANVVAGLVRGKMVDEAMEILRFLPKKAATAIQKTLRSAVANAEHNFSKDQINLKIKSIIVNKGAVWRRGLPSTRGRSLPIRKPTTHISIELESIN